MAEREGFEPSVRFPAHTLSKRAPSANSDTSPQAQFLGKGDAPPVSRPGRIAQSRTRVPDPILRDEKGYGASSDLATLQPNHCFPNLMAEREGFEPSVPVKVQRFSRPPRSTAPAPLRIRAQESTLVTNPVQHAGLKPQEPTLRGIKQKKRGGAVPASPYSQGRLHRPSNKPALNRAARRL